MQQQIADLSDKAGLNILREHQIIGLFHKAGSDLDQLFTAAKLSKDLFEYYETDEIDASYMTSRQRKSGSWRRQLWTIILTKDSEITHRNMNVKWDEKKAFIFRVFVRMRSVTPNEYGRYEDCHISFRYNEDMLLTNVRTHWHHGSDVLQEV